MGYRGKLVPYTHVPSGISKGAVLELLSIIRDEHPRYPKMANNVAPHKIYYFLSCNGGDSLDLRPLGEIFNGYYHELLLPYSLKEWSQNVYSLL